MNAIDLSLFQNAHPIVRDLAWSIGSSPLLDKNHNGFNWAIASPEWCQQHIDGFFSHLKELMIDPTRLISWTSSHSPARLGRYFETLLDYWLHHSPLVSHVKSRLQIRRLKQTIGEMDFLFYDHILESHIHLEVAVKFYLRHNSGQNWDDYIGPSGVDRLDRKLNLLFEKQLPLSQSEEGQKAISTVGCSQHFTPMAFLKGYIFDPIDSEKNLIKPPGLSTHCPSGEWLYQSDFSSLIKSRPDSLWGILPRLSWLSPSVTNNHHQLLRADALNQAVIQYFHDHSHPLLICCFTNNKGTPAWLESNRYFIVNHL